jgi:hypothetical protein
MVDLLYQFERATGSSLNILVEKYLERVLYEKGYLNAKNEVQDIKITLEPKQNLKCNFRKGKTAGESVQLFCDDLYFGYVKKEEFDHKLKQLKQFPYEELKKMDKNSWDSSNGTYHHFLRFKLKNPKMSFEDCIAHIRFQTSYVSSKDVTQIRHNKFSICTVKGEYTSEFKKIMEYLVNLSDDELENLEKELSNTSINRRLFVLNKMEDK